MTVELCDLCGKRVHEINKTEVIVKDYNGLTFDYGMYFRTKRKFKGVICDDCLKLLREKKT